jgi:hypothetical protein
MGFLWNIPEGDIQIDSSEAFVQDVLDDNQILSHTPPTPRSFNLPQTILESLLWSVTGIFKRIRTNVTLRE